jgi:hypothetical protein
MPRTHLDERLELDALSQGGQHEAVGGEGDVIAVVGLGALQREEDRETGESQL